MMTTNWRGYRVTARVGEALLTIAVIATVSQGNWKNALGLALFLAASLAFVVMDDLLPTLFDFLLALAALLNAGGWVVGLFYQSRLYDKIVQAFTIFAVTLPLSFLAYSSMLTIFCNHKLLYLLTITSFGIAIGALWEVAESTAGIVLSTEVIERPKDTIINLIMDSLGAAIAALTSLWTLQEWMRQALRQLGIKHLSPIVRAIALNSKPYHKFFLNHLPSGGSFFRALDRWQGLAS